MTVSRCWLTSPVGLLGILALARTVLVDLLLFGLGLLGLLVAPFALTFEYQLSGKTLGFVVVLVGLDLLFVVLPLGMEIGKEVLYLVVVLNLGLALVAFAILVLEVLFIFVLKYMFLVGKFLVILLWFMLQHLQYRLEVTVERKY
jgi:hypothetical protein